MGYYLIITVFQVMRVTLATDAEKFLPTRATWSVISNMSVPTVQDVLGNAHTAAKRFSTLAI